MSLPTHCCCVLALLCCASSYAQQTPSPPSNNWYVGLEVSGNQSYREVRNGPGHFNFDYDQYVHWMTQTGYGLGLAVKAGRTIAKRFTAELSLSSYDLSHQTDWYTRLGIVTEPWLPLFDRQRYEASYADASLMTTVYVEHHRLRVHIGSGFAASFLMAQQLYLDSRISQGPIKSETIDIPFQHRPILASLPFSFTADVGISDATRLVVGPELRLPLTAMMENEAQHLLSLQRMRVGVTTKL